MKYKFKSGDQVMLDVGQGKRAAGVVIKAMANGVLTVRLNNVKVNGRDKISCHIHNHRVSGPYSEGGIVKGFWV